MNTKIEELMEQACREVDFPTTITNAEIAQEIGSNYMQKFAELLIIECMYIGRLSQINNGLVDADIKDYFGI